MILSSSSPALGSPRTLDPVEMTTPRFASCFSCVPFAETVTARGLDSVPEPLIHVILCFLKRNSTPLEFCCEMARERFIAGP